MYLFFTLVIYYKELLMLVWDSKNIVNNKWSWINKGHTEIPMTLPRNFNKKWKQSCLDVFLGGDAADRSHWSAEVKAPIRVVWRFIASLHPKDIQRTWMGNQPIKWHSQIKMPSNLASLKRDKLFPLALESESMTLSTVSYMAQHSMEEQSRRMQEGLSILPLFVQG